VRRSPNPTPLRAPATPPSKERRHPCPLPCATCRAAMAGHTGRDRRDRHTVDAAARAANLAPSPRNRCRTDRSRAQLRPVGCMRRASGEALASTLAQPRRLSWGFRRRFDQAIPEERLETTPESPAGHLGCGVAISSVARPLLRR
jgi:hypothetical protein